MALKFYVLNKENIGNCNRLDNYGLCAESHANQFFAFVAIRKLGVARWFCCIKTQWKG